jgi:hypothetical protein
MLKFGHGNKKLLRGEVIFDLPAGHTCPFAKECKASVPREGGRIQDGKDTRFRCYAASMELVFKGTRNRRWENFDTLKGRTRREMFEIINFNLPLGLVYRIHSSGDFFSQAYFDAWMDVARAHPERIFYAYTKALPFWVKRLGSIPSNVKLNASYGGTHDALIARHNLKSVTVVNWPHEAAALGLEIDHDDSHAWEQDKSFALLIHGTQKPNTPESKAWTAQKQARKEANA